MAQENNSASKSSIESNTNDPIKSCEIENTESEPNELDDVLENVLNGFDDKKELKNGKNNHLNINGTESTDSSWQNVSDKPSDDISFEKISSSQNSQESSDSFINVQNDENKEEQEDEEEEEEEEEEIEKNLDKALQHKSDGNRYYKLNQFDEALHEYTMAIKYCPLEDDKDNEYMSIFYGNRGACYLSLEEYQEAIEECTQSIEYNDKYIKAYWRRARSYEKLEKWFDAKSDYNKILEIDPHHEITKANLDRIEPLVQKQFEEQKEEVITKLKGGANWLLGKVGLSLDNFEAVQNPQTGAYNINFKQNPQ